MEEMIEIILTGFIIGLGSNFHCIGMCGPIALAVPVHRKNNLTILSGAIQYNIGRVITYGILGAIIGTIGLTINTLGILQGLSIISGIALILYAWKKYIGNIFRFKSSAVSIQPLLNKGLGKVIRSKSPFRLFFLGLLNGLLPCGMVFIALTNALLTGDIIPSSIAMIAFGIGTLPAMIGVIFMMNKITQQTRQRMTKIVPYLLTIVGLLIILRGLNLGIPYISPSVKMIEKKIDPNSNKATEEDETEQTIQMDCCHK